MYVKQEDKVKILRWYISQHCCGNEIQTIKNQTDDIKTLEKLIMKDRGTVHLSNCSQCWYEDRDYHKKCVECIDGSNFTFPYEYWMKVYQQEKS